jgi:hypothetical protein
MKRLIFPAICTVTLLLNACGGEGPTDTENNGNDTLAIDTSLGIDTTDINPIDTVAVYSAGYINEDEALTSQIEKVYGEQWDFCDCVVKNDSVNKAIESAGDDEFDALLVRMDTIDKHCKEMLTAANTTPEERDRHKRKVRKCLKNAGIK